jgi:hypothetical protein
MHPRASSTTNGITSSYEGHAWGAIYNKEQKKYLYVECTGPVLPHSNNNIHYNETVAVQTIYGGSIMSPLSQLTFKGDVYGPACFQPKERYLCVAVQYTQDAGYAICAKKQKRIGVLSDKFKSGDFTLFPLLAQDECRDSRELLNKLNYTPDFRDEETTTRISDTLKQSGIHTVETTKDLIKGMTIHKNYSFRPSVFIPSKSLSDAALVPAIEQQCVADIIQPLPYNTGVVFYVENIIKKHSLVYKDTAAARNDN